jgi:hypothetical protein
MVDDNIVELIERVVREKFSDEAIDTVRVVTGRDYDGDEVFNVTVVYSKNGPLDSHKTSKIVRHVRHKLLEKQQTAFPIFTFRSKSDAARLKPEAA